jgi:hypothetical protein
MHSCCHMSVFIGVWHLCGTTVLSSARPEATWHKQTTGSVIHRYVGELRCTHAAAWPMLLRRVARLAATMMRGC